MMLVTLAEASAHLRRDTSADDMDLTLKIRAASAAVLSYLKTTRYLYQPELDSTGMPVLDSNGWPVPELDSDNVPAVRSDIRAAALLLIGEFYKSREGEQEGAVDAQFGYGYLPRPVVALLTPYRDPALS